MWTESGVLFWKNYLLKVLFVANPVCTWRCVQISQTRYPHFQTPRTNPIDHRFGFFDYCEFCCYNFEIQHNMKWPLWLDQKLIRKHKRGFKSRRTAYGKWFRCLRLTLKAIRGLEPSDSEVLNLIIPITIYATHWKSKRRNFPNFSDLSSSYSLLENR